MAVITISRQFGAGGRTLGAALAKKLGYRYVHEDMIKEVAKKINTSNRQVLAFEKRGTDRLMKFLDRFVSSDFVDRLVSEKYGSVDEGRYLDAVKAIILQIYEEGDTVIIGRGSQFILQGKPNTWHIMLRAGLDHRLKFLMERYRLQDYEAQLAIKRADGIRSRFLSFFAEKDLHDSPASYDLVLNMERITLEKARDLIALLAQNS